ncbi:MAG: D-allose transporter substrate-binding protein [Peptoniphilaceae bacterium]|nr:D-allose transporter substrate-binding protein [Peptoniphilaceae bacterium]MDY6086216.1 D-allose transporter substrate-binding protein [Peptoniphilaceae bacterium]
MKKLLKVAAASLSLLLAFTACAGPAQNAESGTEQTEAQGSAEGEQKYAFVLKVLSSPFWQKMEQGIQDKAKELGVSVEVLAANAEDDIEGQVNILQNVVSKKYTAIGLAPLTADNTVKIVADANQQGILVVDVDERLNFDALKSAGGSVISYVATDNVVVGKTAGEYIAKTIQSGDVAIIEGKAGTPSGDDRKAGAMEAFEAAGLNVVDSQPADWDRTKAFDLATNLIQKNANLKAIYCANDTMAMGAQEAVENSGKDILVVGTDGNEDAVQSVADGKLGATVAQDPAQVGARSLELLVEAVKAGEKPGDKEMITEMVEPILVEPLNVQDYLKSQSK